MKARCSGLGLLGAAEPFDGLDRTLPHGRDRHQARQHRVAAHHHGAGAALTEAAAELRAVEAQVVAQHIEQRRRRRRHRPLRDCPLTFSVIMAARGPCTLAATSGQGGAAGCVTAQETDERGDLLVGQGRAERRHPAPRLRIGRHDALADDVDQVARVRRCGPPAPATVAARRRTRPADRHHGSAHRRRRRPRRRAAAGPRHPHCRAPPAAAAPACRARRGAGWRQPAPGARRSGRRAPCRCRPRSPARRPGRRSPGRSSPPASARRRSHGRAASPVRR